MDPRMKRKVAALFTIAALMSGSVAAFADLSGEAEAHVFVDVVANISVGVVTANVDLGEIQTGVFPGQVVFRVDANVEEVDMQIIATNLYKGDVPDSPFKIPVKSGTPDDGALVEPAFGNATEGHGNLLAWLAGPVILNGMEALETETVSFESGQNGHFSQEVTVTVEYDQADPELPQGEYSGWIKLVAAIQP